MGCDGGTIPRRDELVKVKKKPESKDKDSELAFQWRHCSITQQLLESPIVMCGLGRLYNKVSLIEALINRDTLPDSARHIRSLKDVKNLNLTPNPAYKDDEKKEGAVDSRGAPYICPVIGLEMAGKFRFVGLWSCGCIFSERALKEVKTTVCHKCQKPFTDDDVIVLNGNEDDVTSMQTKLEIRAQKNKKDKKTKVKLECVEAEVKPECDDVRIKSECAETEAKSTDSTNGKANNSVKKSITNLKPAAKRHGAVTKNKEDSRLKKIKTDYSVAKDPAASDVYKSLFTSHKSEQEQGRAHWITYNPFYN